MLARLLRRPALNVSVYKKQVGNDKRDSLTPLSKLFHEGIVDEAQEKKKPVDMKAILILHTQTLTQDRG
jgi:hypothetical protein